MLLEEAVRQDEVRVLEGSARKILAHALFLAKRPGRLHPPVSMWVLVQSCVAYAKCCGS